MSTDGARSSALRFTDDLGVPGHTHPGYTRHFTGSTQPEHPQVGDLWSIGAYVENRYVNVEGTVDGETVEEFPDFTTEPNPTFVTVELGDYAPGSAVISIDLSIDDTVPLDAPVALVVTLGSTSWQWDVFRDPDLLIQTTSFPVTLPSDLAELVGTAQFQLILPFGTSTVSVTNFVVSTSNELDSTMWWDGQAWKALGTSKVIYASVEPSVDSGLTVWIDDNGRVFYNDGAQWRPTKPQESSTGHGVSVGLLVDKIVDVPPSTWYLLPFDTVLADNGGVVFDDTTGDVVIASNGFYQLHVSTAFSPAAVARRIVGLYVNGALVARGDDTGNSSASSHFVGVQAQAVQYLQAGDVVDARVWTDGDDILPNSAALNAAHRFEVWSLGGVTGDTGPAGAGGAQGPAGPPGPEGPVGPPGTLDDHSHPDDYLRLDGSNGPVIAPSTSLSFYLGADTTAPAIRMDDPFGAAELRNPNGNLWLAAKAGSSVELHASTNAVHGELVVDTGWLGEQKLRVRPNVGEGTVEVVNRATLAHQVSSADVVPVTVVGEVRMFTIIAPAGWLPLDGATVAYDDYPQLGAAWGYSPGQTFALPNFADRVPMGGGSLRSVGGTDRISVSQLPSHRHTLGNHSHSASASGDSHSHTLTSGMGDNMGRDTHPHDNNNDRLAHAGGTQITNATKTTASDSHSHSISVAANTGYGGYEGGGAVFQPRHVRLFFAVFAGYVEL